MKFELHCKLLASMAVIFAPFHAQDKSGEKESKKIRS